MSLIRWITAEHEQGEHQDDFLNDPNFWQSDSFVGRRTASGERVTPAKSLSLSSYYACIRNISEDIGKIPALVYRRLPSGGRERATNHPAWNILHDSPNPENTQINFREFILSQALGWGNGYAEIQRNNAGRPIATWPLHASRVNPGRAEDGSIVYEVKVDDVKIPGVTVERKFLRAEDMFHLHGMGGNSLEGWSIARIAAESIGIALAAQKGGGAFFKNGMVLSGVLQHPQKLSPEAHHRLQSSMAEAHTSARNMFKFLILEEGMEWMQTGVSMKDSQFIQTSKFQVEDIARWFRMPPHLIGHLERSTFSNIEKQGLEYVTFTLMSWLVRYEEEATRKLIQPAEREMLFVEHLVEKILRGDPQARGSFYKTLFAMGSISRNEIRARENLNPVENGDEYFLQMNMTTVDSIVTGSNLKGDEPSQGDGENTGNSAAARAEECRPMLIDAAERIIRRERKAIANIVNRDGKDHEDFSGAITNFYAGQGQIVVETFRPCFEFIFSENQYRAIDELAIYSAQRAGNIRGLVIAEHLGEIPEIGENLESESATMVDLMLLDILHAMEIENDR